MEHVVFARKSLSRYPVDKTVIDQSWGTSLSLYVLLCLETPLCEEEKINIDVQERMHGINFR